MAHLSQSFQRVVSPSPAARIKGKGDHRLKVWFRRLKELRLLLKCQTADTRPESRLIHAKAPKSPTKRQKPPRSEPVAEGNRPLIAMGNIQNPHSGGFINGMDPERTSRRARNGVHCWQYLRVRKNFAAGGCGMTGISICGNFWVGIELV